ncbi:MAG: GGDEF domain-containing protein [Candidatus Omnitrophota bacterium]
MIEKKEKPLISFIAYMSLLICSFFVIKNDIIFFIGVNSIAFLFLLFIIFKENHLYSVIAVASFIVAGGIAIVYFEKIYFVFIVIVLFAVRVYYYFHSVCSRGIDDSFKEKQALEEENKTIQDTSNLKEESLHAMETRAQEIFLFFEIAKEFNECLYVHDLIKILTNKGYYDLPFTRGILILLDENVEEQRDFNMYSFSEESWGEYTGDDTYDIGGLVSYFKQETRCLNIDQKRALAHRFILKKDAVSFPLWIFPLLVGGKTIAIIVLEGGREGDFSKFSIIAGQLALQIKKINLYTTVKELSITDGLTGTFLRRHFLERFDEELKRSVNNNYRLCVLMLDIDHFKMYNDTFGHLVGDVTLREVAKILKDNVRKVDLLARYGGEEFAVVFPETDRNGGIEGAERIRAAVARERFKVYDEETSVTVSIGVASFPEDVSQDTSTFHPDWALELLQKADQALYRAKEKGRNTIVCYNAL